MIDQSAASARSILVAAAVAVGMGLALTPALFAATPALSAQAEVIHYVPKVPISSGPTIHF